MKDAPLPQISEEFAAGGMKATRKHGVAPFTDPMKLDSPTFVFFRKGRGPGTSPPRSCPG